VASSVLALSVKRGDQEHEESKLVQSQMDEALRQLREATKRLKHAAELYRERYEGRRDQRGKH